jgi:lipopolysaccharide/colanic/teichoic acid biosynthesis glycosyltransferase
MPKKIFDLTLAALGLILAAPLLALIGILIKLESRGPVFFKHRRVGKDGRLFSMYKFRKMRRDLAGPKISPKYDPRLTKVGRVLERLKLDELPQLVNILKGDMSFVGPRPEIPEIVARYSAEQSKVLKVKPGLVGPNQIIWRNEKNLIPENVSDVESYYVQHILPLKLERDMHYVEAASFGLDLKYFTLALGATLLEPLKPEHFIRRRWEILHLATDLSLCLLALVAAVLIKYEMRVSPQHWQNAVEILPILLFFRLIAFVFLGVYQQVWEYVSKADLWVIIKAVLLPTAFTMLAVFLFPGQEVSFTVLFLEAMLSIGFLSAARLWRNHLKGEFSVAPPGQAADKILIYGANAEGELLLRRMQAGLGPQGLPLGFLDGDPLQRGHKIHGLPVLGNSYDLPMLQKLYGVHEIYIAGMENHNGDLSNLLRVCNDLGVGHHFVTTTYANVSPVIALAGAELATPEGITTNILR